MKYKNTIFLGLEAELYYVRDGVINNYALAFVVAVPSNIDSLHFTWEGLPSKPVSLLLSCLIILQRLILSQLSYAIEIETTNSLALSHPQLNISSTGNVPSTGQTFAVSLPCTGLASAEVNVVITVKINNASGNATALTFKRKKICLKNENAHVEVETVSSQTNSAHIFYFAVSCAVVLKLVLALLVVFYYVRNKKLRRTREENNEARNTFVAAAHRNPSNSYGSFRRMPSYSLIDERSKDLQDRISHLSVQRFVLRCSQKSIRFPECSDQFFSPKGFVFM